MDKGRVGEDRGSKGTDGCPLTDELPELIGISIDILPRLEVLVGFKGHERGGHCKGTSICFLTSSLFSYSPPVYMYFLSSPLYHHQGLHLQPTTSILTARRLPRHQPTGSRQLPRRRPTGSRQLPSPSHRSDLNSTA
jgi:hypothetical protein